MIIDWILDRKENETYGEPEYSPREFYFNVLQYGSVGEEITRAMDSGTEEDVKTALCRYIDRHRYNPEIKKYIDSRLWL